MVFYNIWFFVVNIMGLLEMVCLEFFNEEYFNMMELIVNWFNNIIFNVNELLNFEQSFDMIIWVLCNLLEIIICVIEFNNESIFWEGI